MWHDRLNEAQAGIKIAGRNNNNLRYADDTTLRKQKGAKELLDEEGEWKSLKLNIQNTKVIESGPITSWQTNEGKNGNSDRYYFGRIQNHCGW